jgi:hypothetical protein
LYLEELCALLYDVFRPIFVHVNHLETLTELCIIMRTEIMEDDGRGGFAAGTGSDLEPFTKMITQLMEDVQERLIYRTHIYIKSDILGYSPAPGDLAYPEKLIMMEVGARDGFKTFFYFPTAAACTDYRCESRTGPLCCFASTNS